MLADAQTPFVLLDDAAGGGATLYRAPVRVIEARRADAVRPALAELRAARRDGLHAAGYLAYAAGTGIEPRIAAIGDDRPLAWFGLFERAETVPADEIAALFPDPASAWCAPPRPAITPEEYEARFARVLDYIRAGDIYQANLTFAAEVTILGDPLALYARLRDQARAHYGAVVRTDDTLLLSLSPELFFRLDSGALLARPMKGTAARGGAQDDDRAIADRLAADPKQRAENLMIVDLLRNDLTRVARPGSVKAPRLFAVETYPTIHQMVSDVTAELGDGRDAVDVIETLFPCGSITGAPKIRASEVIAEIEAAPRGAYTGAIGRIAADGDAIFNVAIRTLELAPGAGIARLGLGSGVVADSQAFEEWAECLAKGAFVTAGQRRIDLIETMAFDPKDGILLLERHLARMKASAGVFGIPFDRHATRNELQAATFRLRKPCRIRLLLAPSGAMATHAAPLPPRPKGPVKVAIVPERIAPEDFRRHHKTSDRAFRDAPRRAAGTFEVVFVDAAGFLIEGSFTSLFVERDGMLVTPPLSRGLLPGVLRGDLIDSGRAIEGDLTPADLAQGFFVGNALRGLIPAVAVANEAGL
ncbi:MAG TPA: aminodeoxychorismate synthase component I [Sphingomonas sp.]|nr:aminodeoxychorismate synthase component I [Sphingomonas sp.]